MFHLHRRGHGSQRSILSDSTHDYSSDGRTHAGTYPRQKPPPEMHNGTYPLRYRGSTMQQEETVQVRLAAPPAVELTLFDSWLWLVVSFTAPCKE